MQLELALTRVRFRTVRAAAALLLAPAVATEVTFSQSRIQPGQGPYQHSVFCPPGLQDSSTGTCVGVSSMPTAGCLLPLGPELFVEPLGRVGLGTTLPAVHLDVVGSGGSDSTIRTLTTSSGGAGGILLQRPGGTPVDWALSFDSGPKRDFLIHDNIAAQTRLRITSSGQVECEALRVGNGTAGFRCFTGVDYAALSFGTSGPGLTKMAFDNAETRVFGTVRLDDVVMGYTNSITFSEVIGPPQPMIHMFDGGTASADRMVLAHSPAFPSWGLRYDDAEDAFHFLGNGNGVLTIALSATQGKIGIENTNPSNILTIQQGSPTDPIADAWTVYSSRRWKENIEPLEHGLERVLALRAVTFDWKETGKSDLGMIAEEVGAILPELVEFEENGIDARSVDYARLSAVLVEAVKEQQARVQEQQALLESQAERLRAQERAVQELLARVEHLELSRAR